MAAPACEIASERARGSCGSNLEDKHLPHEPAGRRTSESGVATPGGVSIDHRETEAVALLAVGIGADDDVRRVIATERRPTVTEARCGRDA